jgi:MoaE-MoaD fusion protein
MLKVKLFAAFRELTGQSEIELALPLDTGATVGDALALLTIRYPTLDAGMKSALVMVNRKYAKRETPLQPGDELAVLPPVGGGA